jgi:peptidyl-prolyl cis-trans isomerase-like 4
MAVLLETSAGELVIDLFVDETPIACKNFLKLCKTKYYNDCLFFNVQANYIAQTGDPTGTGKGGTSVYGKMYGAQAVAFQDEIVPHRKHDKLGLVSMVNTGPNTNRSQFFITLRGDDLHHLDGKHTIFGEIAEGFDVLTTINNLYCDDSGRPYQDVRIKHTHILDDPYPDPAQLEIPPSSPVRDRPPEETVARRIAFEEPLDALPGGRTQEELEESIRKKEAQSRAIVLEMTGDIPDADVKPPEEVLFVCKLNPVTRDEDLELIFSRFGKIKKCEIIRDQKTGDSLNYAFIEFETEAACIEAYEKMNNVLIDDRRIKVDFSQSVTKLWNKYLMKPASAAGGKGVPAAKGDRAAASHYGGNLSRGDGGYGYKSTSVYKRGQEPPTSHHRPPSHKGGEDHDGGRRVDRDRDRRGRSSSRDQNRKERRRSSSRSRSRSRSRDRKRRDRSRSRSDSEGRSSSRKHRHRSPERDDRAERRDKKHKRDRRSRSRSKDRHSDKRRDDSRR